MPALTTSSDQALPLALPPTIQTASATSAESALTPLSETSSASKPSPMRSSSSVSEDPDDSDYFSSVNTTSPSLGSSSSGDLSASSRTRRRNQKAPLLLHCCCLLFTLLLLTLLIPSAQAGGHAQQKQAQLDQQLVHEKDSDSSRAFAASSAAATGDPVPEAGKEPEQLVPIPAALTEPESSSKSSSGKSSRSVDIYQPMQYYGTGRTGSQAGKESGAGVGGASSSVSSSGSIYWSSGSRSADSTGSSGGGSTSSRYYSGGYGGAEEESWRKSSGGGGGGGGDGGDGGGYYKGDDSWTRSYEKKPPKTWGGTAGFPGSPSWSSGTYDKDQQGGSWSEKNRGYVKPTHWDSDGGVGGSSSASSGGGGVYGSPTYNRSPFTTGGSSYDTYGGSSSSSSSGGSSSYNSGGGTGSTTGGSHWGGPHEKPLKLFGVEVPVYKFRGEDAQLECKFDRGTDPLYSVKWYKNDNEFFRYLFRKKDPKQVFSQGGVNVDVHRSNERRVLLRNLTFNSTGVYRCEVSADAPHFRTYANQSVMVVVELPERGPTIVGGRSHYKVGDTAQLNCTSSRSKPAAALTWLINEKQASEDMLVRYYPFLHRDGLESRRLGLKFKVNHSHFLEGELVLKCQATVAAIYTAVEEEDATVFEGDPVILEQREHLILVKSGVQRTIPGSTILQSLMALTIAWLAT